MLDCKGREQELNIIRPCPALGGKLNPVHTNSNKFENVSFFFFSV